MIIRPFIPASKQRIAAIIGRALALTEEEVEQQLQAVRAEFDSRHFDIESLLLKHYAKVQTHVFTQRPLSPAHGGCSSARCSPVNTRWSPPPCSTPPSFRIPIRAMCRRGGLRFIMSLRATGRRAHLVHRVPRRDHLTGWAISASSPRLALSRAGGASQPHLPKESFIIKLHEMGFDDDYATAVLDPLADDFTRSDLGDSVSRVRRDNLPITHDVQHTLECIKWLADSNYELCFSSRLAGQRTHHFPGLVNESNGIEDARFVRFTDDDGNGHVLRDLHRLQRTRYPSHAH